MSYPLVGFHFLVEFSGVDGLTNNDVRFQEVSGLSSEIGTEELKEGGENRFSHKLPMPAQYPNLILKRGMVKETGLIKWFRDAIEHFDFKPVTVTVSLLNEQHETVMGWSVVRAYPIKWSVSDLNATRNDVMVDTIELSYQYFNRIY